MTMRVLLSILVVVSWSLTSDAQTFRNQDAAIGGVAGAVLGSIIGHQNDETSEGALIGGAVGAIAGGLLGNAKDQQVARQRRYKHQVWQDHRQRLHRVVSVSDVINMSRSGLSDSVIINHIRANGAPHVGTDEIIALHNNGVSESVISTMQQAPMAGQILSETVLEHTPARPTTVVVREEYHVAPPFRRYVRPPRSRYTTRPAFPTYPSRVHFHRYW